MPTDCTGYGLGSQHSVEQPEQVHSKFQSICFLQRKSPGGTTVLGTMLGSRGSWRKKQKFLKNNLHSKTWKSFPTMIVLTLIFTALKLKYRETGAMDKVILSFDGSAECSPRMQLLFSPSELWKKNKHFSLLTNVTNSCTFSVCVTLAEKNGYAGALGGRRRLLHCLGCYQDYSKWRRSERRQGMRPIA